MAGSGCGRFYVLTGPEYGEKVDRQIVEVDLIIAGKTTSCPRNAMRDPNGD
jgi:hypothetical protein